MDLVLGGGCDDIVGGSNASDGTKNGGGIAVVPIVWCGGCSDGCSVDVVTMMRV